MESGPNSVPPPMVAHGIEFVIVRVGPDNNQKSFAIHKDLIAACSPFFRAAVRGQFRESSQNVLNLPEESHTVFQPLYDWLYRIPVNNNAIDRYNDDAFYLEVFRMADRHLVAGLKVIALEKLMDMFTNNTSQGNIVPSAQLINSLFADNELDNRAVIAIQEWILEHINWALHFKSSSMRGVDDLMKQNERFGTALGLTLVGKRIRNNKTNPHPATQKGFTIKYGLNLEELRTEAFGQENSDKSRSTCVDDESQASLATNPSFDNNPNEDLSSTQGLSRTHDFPWISKNQVKRLRLST